MNKNISQRRTFYLLIYFFLVCYAIFLRPGTTFANQISTAMKYLEDSVKERDQMFIDKIKDDEQKAKVEEEKQVSSFLDKPLEKVETVNMQARRVNTPESIHASIANYQTTGHAEPLINNDEIIYPYGLVEPVLVCLPLRICHIQLQEGEEIIDTSAGDTQRWWFGYTFIGQGSNVRPNVLVKPLTDSERLETSLSISTNRRLYYIILRSTPSGNYTKKISFFYPQDYKKSIQTIDELKAKVLKYKDENAFDPLSQTSIDKLNFDYVVKGNKNLKWYPKRVFSDDKHVFIEMPRNVQSFELPIFMVLGEDNQYQATNYRFKFPYYVTDRIFNRGVLLLTGPSRKEEKIMIINKGLGNE